LQLPPWLPRVVTSSGWSAKMGFSLQGASSKQGERKGAVSDTAGRAGRRAAGRGAADSQRADIQARGAGGLHSRWGPRQAQGPYGRKDYASGRHGVIGWQTRHGSTAGTACSRDAGVHG
jgi:hypothetical protein